MQRPLFQTALPRTPGDGESFFSSVTGHLQILISERDPRQGVKPLHLTGGVTCPARIVNLLTVALLAALISLQTFAAGQQLVLDARVPAVLVAAVLFALRVPFLVVIVAAAAVAAGIRALT